MRLDPALLNQPTHHLGETRTRIANKMVREQIKPSLVFELKEIEQAFQPTPTVNR